MTARSFDAANLAPLTPQAARDTALLATGAALAVLRDLNDPAVLRARHHLRMAEKLLTGEHRPGDAR